MKKMKLFAGIWAVIAIVGIVTPAHADFIGSYITIEATNENGTATFESQLPPQASDKASWALAEAFQLRGGPNNDLIATIDDLTVSLDGDPQVLLNFVVTSGGSATNFTITSATVSFPSLVNPLAKATAAVTLTDNSADGASLNFTSPNVTGMYRALYNGTSIFSEELSSLSIPGGSGSLSNGNPPFQVINTTVSSIQSNFAFRLSANDAASGTSNFTVVIPEPASLALLGLGALAMIRRW